MPDQDAPKVVPHRDGSLVVCCGENCVRIETSPTGTRLNPPDPPLPPNPMQPPDALLPPDLLFAAREAVLVTDDDDTAVGLFPSKSFSKALDSLDPVDVGGVTGPPQIQAVAGVIECQVSVRVLADLISPVSQNDASLQIGLPGSTVALDRLAPLFKAARAQGRAVELHMLAGDEDRA